MSGPQTSRRHLSDEQFSDLLAGQSPDSCTEAHLAACARCQAELEALGGALQKWNAISLAWAEREAPRRVHTPSRWRLRLGAHPGWNAGLVAAATAAVVAIGVRLPQHPAPPATGAATVQVEVAAPNGAELAADNHLLASINQELSYTTQPAVPLAALKDPERHGSAGLRETVAN